MPSLDSKAVLMDTYRLNLSYSCGLMDSFNVHSFFIILSLLIDGYVPNARRGAAVVRRTGLSCLDSKVVD
jgi:hypothetical protein